MFIWKISSACLITFSCSSLRTLRRFLVKIHLYFVMDFPVAIVIEFCLNEIFAKIGGLIHVFFDTCKK